MFKRLTVAYLMLLIVMSFVACKSSPPQLDITPLQKLMSVTYQEIDYTPSTYKKYATALTKAQEFVDTDNKVQSDYDKVFRDLKAAIILLNKRPNKTILSEKVLEAEKYEKAIDNYYKSSTENFLSSLKKARDQLKNDDTTQEAVDIAVQRLTDGIKQLQLKADKSNLIELVATAKEIAKEKYLNTDWKQFDIALSNAERIIERESATEVEIKNTQTALTEAISRLVKKPDMTALQELYDQSEEIDQDLYAKDSLSRLNDAKILAWRVLYIEPVDQASVDRIATELNNALNSLKFKVTKKYRITCTAKMISNNHVGNQWSYYTTVNNHDFWKTYVIEEEVDTTIKAKATVCESDAVPDYGSTSFELVMTDGYSISVEVIVVENRGTYAGNRSKWQMTYQVSEEIEE